jgi:hypothetical protein
MDFFDMEFSTLFLEKHGKENFENINRQILQEKQFIINNNNDYIEIVFKIAFLDFFGLDNDTIRKMIENIMNCHQINIEQMKSIHKNSINEIQKCLQSAMDIELK